MKAGIFLITVLMVSTPEVSSALFEIPLVGNADEVLPPPLISGPHCKVDDIVSSSGCGKKVKKDRKKNSTAFHVSGKVSHVAREELADPHVTIIENVDME